MQEMSPVPDVIVGAPSGGIIDNTCFAVPAAPNPDMEVGGSTACEFPVSGYIGVYNFNWSRLLAHQLGGNEAGGGPVIYTVGSWFRQMKLHRGYMTIERIDTGATQRLVTHALIPPPPATIPEVVMGTYADPKPVPLFIYYIHMNAREHSMNAFLQNANLFRGDPRCRRIKLMPGQKVTFKFRPVRFLAPQYLAHLLRDRAGPLGAETDQFRRCELPSRTRPLGWLPTSVGLRLNAISGISGIGQGGLGPAVFPIVSNSLAFLFDIPRTANMQGAANMGLLFGAADQPWTNASRGVLIRRREFTAVSFSDFIFPSLKTTAPITPTPGVGQIVNIQAWNGGTASENTVELFDAPRLGSLVAQSGVDYALWRPGAAFTTSLYTPSQVPFDTEYPTVVDKAPPTIPPVSLLP